jgi:CheY-like chemotaxis protein
MSRKLLLADDSITIQKVIGITFANEDYDLTVVDNGDAAFEKACANRPDLILADVFMPGKNGYELCAAIKQEPILKGVPVLLLSGTFEPFDANKAKAAGADSWIAKPFESQALIDKVEELLARTPAVPPQPAPEAAAQPEAELSTAQASVPPQESGSDSETESDMWDEFEETAPAAMAAIPAEEEGEEQEDDLLDWDNPLGDSGESEDFMEDDLWDSVSFEEEDLMEDIGQEAAGDDLWGSLDEDSSLEEFVPAPIISDLTDSDESLQLAEGVFGQEDESMDLGGEDPFAPPADLSIENPFEEQDEDEIVPLEDVEILEEEDLDSALDRDEISFGGLEDDIAESNDAGLSIEDEKGNGSPVVEKDPQWDIAGEETKILATGDEDLVIDNDFDFGDYEEVAGITTEDSAFILSPAEAAMDAAASQPTAMQVEEQVRTLNEEEIAAVVEKVAATIIERLAGSILEKIAWEVVPDLAESMIKDELRKIKEGV